MEILNSAKIKMLLKLRPRLTTSQVAEAICVSYEEAKEEVMHLYSIGCIKQFKTKLGLLVWEIAPEEEQSGGQGAGALTLDMPVATGTAPIPMPTATYERIMHLMGKTPADASTQAQPENHVEIAENVPQSKLARWREKRAETPAKHSITFVAWEDWNGAIDKAKEAWLIKNRKGGSK